MRTRLLALTLILAAATSLIGCDRNPKPGSEAAAGAPRQQQAWSAIVAGHTTGVVSRRSAVHVLFSGDVTQAGSQTGAADAGSVFSLEPAVAGKAEFVGSRELVFTPAKELAPGQTYTARLLPKGLKGVPPDLTPYEFKFGVQTPQFEVAVQGLESDAANDKRMLLRASLTSADVEDNAKIEQLVSATFLGKPVALQWTHSSDGLNHPFTIAAIERQAASQPLVLRWNGQPIGATATGEIKTDIPARDAFLVTDAQAIEAEGRKQILITFSDSLAAKQNLRGLVRIADVEFTTRIDKNLLTIYPTGELEGDVSVTLEPGIRNERGDKLMEQVARSLSFTSTKPQVRWVGKGVILPDSKTLTVPFEAVSARSVRVIATRIYDDNVAQFLQVNTLTGNNEIGRVGRFLWSKNIALTGPRTGRWQRYSLDVTELTQKFPGGMFQLTLQLTPRDSDYKCSNTDDGGRAVPDPELKSQDDDDQSQSSNWDYSEDYYGEGESDWNKRSDPCNKAYFQYGENISASRNLLASNIGLLAKRDQRGKLLVAATDLRTAATLSGTKISVRNFQNQEIGVGTTDSNGLATIAPNGTPFLVVGEANNQRGFLRVAAGVALPVSHFDVGGEVVAKGLKGFIYGDRGVWRPGDALFMTFVLQDKDKTLPANHPVTMEFYNPRGQLVQTVANSTPVGGFYSFTMKTDANAPTGDWTVKALLGGTSFSKRVKVETIMPNRMKVELNLGAGKLAAPAPIAGSVNAQWLSGSTAAGLKTDVNVRLTPTTTAFTSFRDFVFDDPAREFSSEPLTVFEGTLNDDGSARFEQALKLDSAPPGMLSATFTTRVFERGGAFSINRETTTYAPFARFVGLRLPKGDVARDMLMTDTEHAVEIASLGADGKPAAIGKVQVTLYKVEWKWWWDKNGDSLAQYVQGQSNAVVRTDTVSTTAGRGVWKFNIRYPEWGRYLVRVCDVDGGHCAGRTFYIDWPSWAGKQRDQSGPAASVLTVTADKEEYKVGDTANIQLPESAQGRALVTIENGTSIIDARWVEPAASSMVQAISSRRTPST